MRNPADFCCARLDWDAALLAALSTIPWVDRLGLRGFVRVIAALVEGMVHRFDKQLVHDAARPNC
jgi:hypothetical protein